MLTILITVTLALQAILTGGSIALWNTISKNTPAMQTKVFFLITGVRFVASLIVFAISLYLMHGNTNDIKIFTVVFMVLYLLLLVFDTLYFLHSIKTKDK